MLAPTPRKPPKDPPRTPDPDPKADRSNPKAGRERRAAAATGGRTRAEAQQQETQVRPATPPTDTLLYTLLFEQSAHGLPGYEGDATWAVAHEEQRRTT